MSTSPDRQLAASCPHGVFTLDEAVAAGFSPAGVRNRLRRGTWRELTRGVYASTTTPLTVHSWERSAVRSYPGRAVLSHFSAARGWGIPAEVDPRAWMTVEAASRWVLPPDVRAVRTRHMPTAWTRDGLPVTPPARTVVDLAMCVRRARLREAVTDVLNRRLCTLGHLTDEVRLLSRRTGHAALRETLAEFSPQFESVLEELVAAALRRHRVTGFEAQYVIRDAAGLVVARADFADPVCRLVLEVDGWAFHGSRAQQQQDKRRDRRLAGLGWQTLRFTTEDVLGRIDSVVAEIVAVRGARSTAA